MSARTDEKKRELKNVKWVSHYLGVSRNTVHQWVLEGHIPYINLGVSGGRRIIRFNPETIEQWLQDRSFSPAEQRYNPSEDKSEIGDDGDDGDD